MENTTFEVKQYPEKWKSPGIDVERFEKMRCRKLLFQVLRCMGKQTLLPGLLLLDVKTIIN